MATVAVVTIPADEMALSDTLGQLPECHFRVEETAFTDTDDFVHLWITCDDCSSIGGVLDADSSVRDHSIVKEAGAEQLYRVELTDRMLLPREVIHRVDGTISEAYGHDGEWTLEVRFADREAVSKTAEQFDRFDVEATYESITELDQDAGELPNRVTGRQREVLRTAIDEGYYEIPRQVTLEELAEELDVSHQALSECLRRAQKQLAQNQISTGTDRSFEPVSD